jgi:hypothetical protein
MIGYVVNVHFLILIGDRVVRNVMNHVFPVVLFLVLKIGNVSNVVISIMHVEWNVIDVKDPNVGISDG